MDQNKCEQCQTSLVTVGTSETKKKMRRIHPCGRTDVEIKRCFFARDCKNLMPFHGTAIRSVERARADYEELQHDCPLRYSGSN